MKAKQLLLLAPLALALAACTGSGLTEAELDAKGFRLMPIAVSDPMINNTKAFTFLAPKGWDYEARVEWRHEFENLASAHLIVANPDNQDMVQVYPYIPYVWVENPVIPMAEGTIYIGGYVLRPIRDPSLFIERIVVPAFRPNIANVQLLDITPLTSAAQAIWTGYYNSDPGTGVSAVRVTIRYDLNGATYDEAFFCALSYIVNPIMPTATLWRPEFLYSLRSAPGGLPAAEGLLQAVASSITVDMKWYANYLQVHELWQKGQMQAIQNAGELSRYLTNVNNEINDIIIDGYNQRQAAEDRIYNQFSESIRGVETYVNPFTDTQVQLPADFDNVWVNSRGEYFLSAEAGVNPNVGSTVTWRRLQAAP